MPMIYNNEISPNIMILNILLQFTNNSIENKIRKVNKFTVY